MKRGCIVFGRKIVLGLIGFGFLFSCSRSTLNLSNTPLPAPRELMSRIGQHASRLETFQGWARLTVVSETESFVASLRIRAKPPDSLWFKIEGPMGVDVLVGQFFGEEALLYSPWEHTVYEGSARRFQTLQILPFPVYFRDLVLGVLGLPVPDMDIEDASISISPDSKQYLLDLESRARLIVTPNGPAVTQWEALDSLGNSLWNWSGERFRKKRGIWLPYMVRITQDNPKQRVTVFYESIKINRRLKKQWSHFRIPEGAYRFEF